MVFYFKANMAQKNTFQNKMLYNELYKTLNHYLGAHVAIGNTSLNAGVHMSLHASRSYRIFGVSLGDI